MTVETKTKQDAGFITDVFESIKFKPTQAPALGCRVRHTHLAAIVRWKEQEKFWKIVDPRNQSYPKIGEPVNQYDPLDSITTDFFNIPLEQKINKHVIVWPQIGEGILIGLIKKGIGLSVGSHQGSGNYFESPEYEPGYFESKEYVYLYVIKYHLYTQEYSLAPVQAMEVI